MAKHGGYPGGMMPGNMANLMKQAQKMQAEMQEQQAAFEEKEPYLPSEWEIAHGLAG